LRAIVLWPCLQACPDPISERSRMRIVEVSFGALGLIPAERHARVVEASITWNYTTWLNIVFLALAALLVWRFLRTGGLEMLRMMNRPAEIVHAHHGH
jgi:uncharacterized protein